MKLSQIVSPEFTQSLKKLLDTKLPVVTAYRLKTVTSVIEAEQNKFEEFRQKLVEKYAEKDEKGDIKKTENGTYGVAKDSVPDFMKEVQELLSVEVEIPTIKLASIGDKAELTAREVAALEGLLIE